MIDAKTMRAYGVPRNLHGGLVRYFNDRIKPGIFLTAVLENDLAGAVNNTDGKTTLSQIGSINAFLLCHADFGAWGSPEKVAKWLTMEVAK